MRTQIFKTEFQAIRQAKYEFANILGINKSSVRIGHNKYHEGRYGSTTCSCGQTTCIYLEMVNAGKKQLAKLEKAFDRAGAVIAFGICESCGDTF